MIIERCLRYRVITPFPSFVVRRMICINGSYRSGQFTMKTSRKSKAPAVNLSSKKPGKITEVPEAAGASGGPTGGFILPHHHIAERAYFLYIRNGCIQGQDHENWREADAQLAAEAHLRAFDP